jgi:hypothetical protein
MKNVFLGLAIATALAMPAAVVYAQQSLAGTWTMSVQGMSLQLALTQDGEKIAGTLESPHGNIRVTGEFSRGRLTISGTSAEGHPVAFAGTATLAADGSLAGNLSVNQMEMTFTAVRAPGK